VKGYVGRGEQRISMMKRDKTFSSSTVLILLVQQEGVLWGCCLQEQQSEVSGELFGTLVWSVPSFKV